MEMNLLDTNDHAPTNPWITLASTSNLPEDVTTNAQQAMPQHSDAQVDDNSVVSSQVSNDGKKKAKVACNIRPHASFWGCSS